MMASAVATLVFLVVGILMWVLSSNAIVKEAGKITFGCGMFWLIYVVLGHKFTF